MRILGHCSFIYVYMTTCLQLLSTKMQFWVSAPFLLEYCSPVRTKRVSTSDKTQSALKTPFSLITAPFYFRSVGTEDYEVSELILFYIFKNALQAYKKNNLARRVGAKA